MTSESSMQAMILTTPRRARMRGSGFDQVRGNAAIHDAEHLAHDRWTAGEHESRPVREAQHPLAHWLCGKGRYRPVAPLSAMLPKYRNCRKTARFAAKRYEVLSVTRFAAHAQETVLKAAAFEVGLELALEIAWQCRSLRRQAGLERGIVVIDELIKEGAFPAMAFVGRRPKACTGLPVA